MSKARKKARKAAKKVIGMCLKCGDPLRRKDARCKGCGRVSPLFQGKSAQRLSAPLFLAKGGNVVPLGRAVAVLGRPRQQVVGQLLHGLRRVPRDHGR